MSEDSTQAAPTGAQQLVAFVAGVIFAIGLGLSGMTLPSKVIGFLDVTGAWDGSLAFVMGGAVIVYAIAYRFVLKMEQPLLATRFELPKRRDISGRLLVGSSLFGIGWGLSGFCPGPALVSAAAGFAQTQGIIIFLASAIAGMLLLRLFDRASSSPEEE